MDVYDNSQKNMPTKHQHNASCSTFLKGTSVISVLLEMCDWLLFPVPDAKIDDISYVNQGIVSPLFMERYEDPFLSVDVIMGRVLDCNAAKPNMHGVYEAYNRNLFNRNQYIMIQGG